MVVTVAFLLETAGQLVGHGATESHWQFAEHKLSGDYGRPQTLPVTQSDRAGHLSTD